ncbi:MAG: hypothetical protein U0Y68_06225 [Blastocatellia bacterium]
MYFKQQNRVYLALQAVKASGRPQAGRTFRAYYDAGGFPLKNSGTQRPAQTFAPFRGEGGDIGKVLHRGSAKIPAFWCLPGFNVLPFYCKQEFFARQQTR